MRNVCKVVWALWFLAMALQAGTAAGEEGWGTWNKLVGDWVADGAPDQGSGSFSFQFDLQDKVLVRKNRADQPAAKGRSASHHEDLMVIYRDPQGAVQADYFDNEGHVIRYACQASADGKSWTLLSSGTPAFRLSYALTGTKSLSVKFEISPSGKPDAFKPYLSGVARRKDRL